jgi:predicted DNA-binding protein (MmcQ/YjbR family)
MTGAATPPAGEDKWTALRRTALGLPGAWEDFPWGEVVVKVNKKIFVFLGQQAGETPAMTVKLTASNGHALSVAGAAAAGYGLGKAGWVTVPMADLETDLLGDWILESYRNVAPKRLAAELDRA